jgi:hypothetical protein
MDVKLWQSQQVLDWLSSVGFGKYRELFMEQNIDGVVLSQISESDLRYGGIKNIGDRKKLISFIDKLKSEKSPNQHLGLEPQFQNGWLRTSSKLLIIHNWKNGDKDAFWKLGFSLCIEFQKERKYDDFSLRYHRCFCNCLHYGRRS